MFELHVSDTDVSGGSVSVGWCVSPDTLKELADKGIKNPAVVIITEPDGENSHYAQSRFVAKLSDLITYVSFKSHGKNNIWGFICEDVKASKRLYLSTDYGAYKRSLSHMDLKELNTFGTWRFTTRTNEYPSVEDTVGRLSDLISVEVPEACFAKEPPEWEKTWVNWLRRDKAIDQCDFRRRRLFAYTVQPILMFFNLFARLTLTLVAGLIASRGFTFKYLLHPLTHDVHETNDLFCEGSFCYGQTDNGWRNAATLPFLPVLICFYLFAWQAHFVVGFVWVALIIATILAVGIGLATLILKYQDYKKEQEKLKEAWYLNQDEMQLILCNSNKKATSIKDLPFAKKTIRLRFQDLKSKVCRPFSA